MQRSLDDAVREAAVRDVETVFDSAPDAMAVRHQRACLLGLLGRRDDAQAAFVQLLAQDPKNFGVLNDFGMFLFAMGLRKAAAVAMAEAVRWHPDDAVGLTNYASLSLAGGDVERAEELFERAVARDPANPKAREGLSIVLERKGDLEGARRHRPTVLRPISAIAPFSYEGPPVRVLLVESAIGGNIFARGFLDDPAFDVRQVFIEYCSETVPLPEHDVVWNAIGDAERCGNVLELAPQVFGRTGAPVISSPHLVRHTRRVDVLQRLGHLPNVVVPHIAQLERSRLATEAGSQALAEAGFTFPVLLRSPGFHTGEHFLRVDSAAEVRDAAEMLPGKTLNAIAFLDLRGSDGCIRKYRVMMVDGKLYPLHLAVAKQWKVHYFSADMAENPAHRAEDEAFLRDMDAAIGRKATGALRAVAQTLALDYGGIDFALDRDRRLVVFEANATMIVPEPDNDPRFVYRTPHLQRMYDAVRSMIVRAARRQSITTKW